MTYSFDRCPQRPRRVVSGSGAEDRSEMSAHEAREDRWDGFGGDEPVIPLLPPLTGSCPASSMRRSKANCRDASGHGSTLSLRPGVCRVDRQKEVQPWKTRTS